MRTVEHWIDGKSEITAGARRVEVTSPIDRQVRSSIPLGTAHEVELAVNAAQAAWGPWFAQSPADRGRILESIGSVMRANFDELVDVEIAETGKLLETARSEVEASVDYFEYYGGIIRAFFGDVIELGADQHAFTRNEPFGVVGVITPWNSPLLQAARAAAPAIAVGNAIVIKPSTYGSSSTVLLAQLASEAGLPAGLFNVVMGSGRTVGAGIIAHPHVRKVVFTGSVPTGRVVAESAARRLIPATLELGGKSPNVMFADADLEAAAQSATSFVKNCGQVCSALTRLIVERSVYDEVVQRVGAITKTFTPGDRLAPLTTEAQFEIVKSYFAVAERDGARLVTGGTIAVSPELASGRYVEPTVYSDVTANMRIFKEEVFGPVLTVTPFDTEGEAIELANDSEFGLAAGLWTGDAGRALRVASQLQAGQVLVNGGRSNNETPFGGFKNSGIGREKGLAALREYTQIKTVVMDIGG